MKKDNNALDTTDLIDKKISYKFLNVLDKEIKHNLEILDNIKVKHNETINLLKQSYYTIINSEQNLNKYNFVDANTLLRSSIEYLIMGFMINESENTFNEFILLGDNVKRIERKYTIVNTLLCEYSKRIKKIAPILFADITRKECKLLLTDMYDLLCKYSHASIIVNLMSEIREKYQKEIVKEFMMINLHFTKILILYTTMYLADISETEITEELIINTFLIYLIKLYMTIEKNNTNFKIYEKILYLDNQNKNYYLNFIEKINGFTEEMLSLQNMLKENKDSLIEIVNDYLMK